MYISRMRRQRKYRQTTCIHYIHFAGRLKFCLKRRSHSLKLMNIKRERIECHVYGQLIDILLCSSTMFQIRLKQELSEYKAIYMIKYQFPLLFQAITVGAETLLKIQHRLYQLLKKNIQQCHRYKDMTLLDVLRNVYKTTVKHRHAKKSHFNNMSTILSLASFEARIISSLVIYLVSLIGYPLREQPITLRKQTRRWLTRNLNY